ncbi:MAG: ParB/RepB/Spo0J family partition protein [Lachnotalea sp.]
MAVRAKGLGKGLDLLIPDTGMNNKTKIIEKIVEKQVETKIKITSIEPNRDQPRKNFDEDTLLELAESVKQFGVIQPLVVQERDGYYEIIAGERRWRAAKIAGLKEVPAIIRKYSEQEIVEISLIENIQRENLNPIEEAFAYKKLLHQFNLKQDEVAERVSKSRTAVTNSLRLLKLDEKVQQMIIDEKISTGHARTLIVIEDSELQYNIAVKIFDEKLSVRETEKLVKKMLNDKMESTKEVKNTENDFIYKSIEDKMKSIIGTKVTINQKKNNKGKIEIEYYSNDELERIFDLLQSIEK